LITRAEVREAVLGGWYVAAMRSSGRDAVMLGIDYGIAALAGAHLTAAHDVAAAASALLRAGARAKRLRAV
jgi:hypothetical protein